ncbi:CBS domain-containing protein [Seongchinamella sediminis]|uniref:CBS domain-containing protein n=1 Tax=Seongchinamella sediminis TaxID=2283635 RepID=A0A3L7E530_9GAMM|nr:CBS domain-containing protein [Seongchinamella sediminis]RLQ23803.1 CBS domain-containing protein [Seongchinamella sediminis]
MLSVAEIMTVEPYTLTPDDSLAQARKLMADHHIRHIPIVSGNGILVGVVSQRDVLAAADSSVLPNQSGREQEERYIALSSVMTSPVQTVDEHASLRGTAMHLQQQRLGCLPVTRDDQLVGIVTDSDFVAVAINLMEQLEQVEPVAEDFDDGY